MKGKKQHHRRRSSRGKSDVTQLDQIGSGGDQAVKRLQGRNAQHEKQEMFQYGMQPSPDTNPFVHQQYTNQLRSSPPHYYAYENTGQERQHDHTSVQETHIESTARRRSRRTSGGRSSAASSQVGVDNQSTQRQYFSSFRHKESNASASSHGSSPGYGSSAEENDHGETSGKFSQYHRNNSHGSHLSGSSGGSSDGGGRVVTKDFDVPSEQSSTGISGGSGSGSVAPRRLVSSNAARHEMLMLQHRHQLNTPRSASSSAAAGEGNASVSSGTPSDNYFISEPSASESEALSSFHGLRFSPVPMHGASHQHQEYDAAQQKTFYPYQHERHHQEQHWKHGAFAPLSPSSISPTGRRPMISHAASPLGQSNPEYHLETQQQRRQMHDTGDSSRPMVPSLDSHVYASLSKASGSDILSPVYSNGAPLSSPTGGLEAVLEVDEPPTPSVSSSHKRPDHSLDKTSDVLTKNKDVGTDRTHDTSPPPPPPPSSSPLSAGSSRDKANDSEIIQSKNLQNQHISNCAVETTPAKDTIAEIAGSASTTLEEKQKAKFNQMFDDVPTPLVGNRKQPLPGHQTKKMNRGLHRRKRSGDAVAASLWLNFRQKHSASTNSGDLELDDMAFEGHGLEGLDWSGMQLDGLAHDWFEEDDDIDGNQDSTLDDEANVEGEGTKEPDKTKRKSPKKGKGKRQKPKNSSPLAAEENKGSNREGSSFQGPALPSHLDEDVEEGSNDRQACGTIIQPRRTWSSASAGNQSLTSATSDDEGAMPSSRIGLSHQRSFTNRSQSRMRTSSGESSLASSKDSSIFSWISGKLSGVGSSVGENARGVSKDDNDGENVKPFVGVGEDSVIVSDSKSSPDQDQSSTRPADVTHKPEAKEDNNDNNEDANDMYQSDDDEIRSIEDHEGVIVSDNRNHGDNSTTTAEPQTGTDDEDWRASLIRQKACVGELTPLRSPAQRLMANESDLQYSPMSSPDNAIRQVRFTAASNMNNSDSSMRYIDDSVDPCSDNRATYRMPTGEHQLKQPEKAKMRRNFSKSELAQMYDPAKSMLPGDDQNEDDGGQGKGQIRKCPRCGALQRQFFGVDNAPSQFDSPAGFLALYFGIYVVASFFLFGIEEGWKPLDCVYFAVITLTTAGLGDLHPTSPQAKLICSIFIYFGVACIGLLLGSLLASSLDDESRRAAKEQLADNCLNCQRLGLIHDHEHTHTGGIPKNFGPQDTSTFHTSVRPESYMSIVKQTNDPIQFGNKSFFSERFNATTRGLVSSLRGIKGPLFRKKKTDDEVDESRPLVEKTAMDGIKESNSPNSLESKTGTTAATPTASSNSNGGARQNVCNSNHGDDGNEKSRVSSPSTSSGDGDDEVTDHSFDEEQAPDAPALANQSGYTTNTNSSVRAPSHHYNISPVSPRATRVNQSHTRHFSIDVQYHSLGAPPMRPTFVAPSTTFREPSGPYQRASRGRNFSYDTGPRPTTGPPSSQVNYGVGFGGDRIFENPPSSAQRQGQGIGWGSGDATDDEISTSSGSSDGWEDPSKPLDGFAAARHVFLTLKQAVMNSLLIILVGSLGFYYIEQLNAVDAFYFTTVLLTTVGYGDIVPVTNEGKVFATIYVLVAGTILLHNMSLISMIPLELRKRRIERAVLMQFGEHLDDEALRELATGPLTRRLQLAANRSDGLNECTREMFSLAMLVRLGRISERDVKATFDAFRRLDRDNDGKLSSKDIIFGMVDKNIRQRKLRDSIKPRDVVMGCEMEGEPGIAGGAGLNLGDNENASYLTPSQYNGRTETDIGSVAQQQHQFYPGSYSDLEGADDFIQASFGPQGPLVEGGVPSSYGSHQGGNIRNVGSTRQMPYRRHRNVGSVSNPPTTFYEAPFMGRADSYESLGHRSHRSHQSEAFAPPYVGGADNRGNTGIGFGRGAGLQSHSLSTRHLPTTTAGYGTYDRFTPVAFGKSSGGYDSRIASGFGVEYYEQNLSDPEIYGSHPIPHWREVDSPSRVDRQSDDPDENTQYVSPNSVSNV